MAVADFCQFVAPYQKLIARMRVVTYTYDTPCSLSMRVCGAVRA